MDYYGQEIPLQCNFCNKTFSGAIPAQQHFNSAAHKKKEATAQQLSSAGGSNYLVCDICNITCDTVMMLDQHKSTPRHLANVEKKRQLAQVDGPIQQPLAETNVRGIGFPASHDQYFARMHSDEVAEKEYVFDGNRGYCYLCSIDLTSEQHATQHLNGSKHRKKKVSNDQRLLFLGPTQSVSPEASHVLQRNNPSGHPQMHGGFVSEETIRKEPCNYPKETKTAQPVQRSGPVEDNLYCEICDFKADDPHSMIDHLKSCKHETNVLNKNIQLSRSSSMASNVDSECMSDNNQRDYVSYSEIDQQVSALGMSDYQQETLHPGGQKGVMPETMNRFQKYFKINEVNLKVESLLSEESSLSYRTAEDQSLQDIPVIAKPFPNTTDNNRIVTPQSPKIENIQNERSATNASVSSSHDVYGKSRIVHRSVSAYSEPGPSEFMGHNLNLNTEGVEGVSLPPLLNNAGQPVGIGRGLFTASSGQSIPLIKNNLMKLNTDQLGIDSGNFERTNVKQEQNKDTGVSNLATQMLNLQFEDAINAKPFTEELHSSSNTDQSECSINAKPFGLETPCLNVLGSRINVKSFSPSTSLNENEDISAKTFASEQNHCTGLTNMGTELGRGFVENSQVQPLQNSNNSGKVVDTLPDELQSNMALRGSSNVAARTTAGKPGSLNSAELDHTFDSYLNRGHCRICDIALTSRQHMEQHLSGRKHINAKALMQTLPLQGVYKRELFCEICLVPFTGPEAQEQHMKSEKHRKKLEQRSTCSIDKPGFFFCEDCKVECSGEDNFRQHLAGEKHIKKTRGHVQDQLANRCEVCDYTVNSPEQLAIHQKANHPEKLVNNASAGIGQLNTNLNTAHLVGGSITLRPGFYYCEVCKVECSGGDNYKQHLSGEKHRKKLALTSGNGKSTPFQCDMCNCVVNSQEQLWVHQSAKHPEKLQTLSVVGRETFSNLQNTVSGNSTNMKAAFGSNPLLEEFLSLELFPEHKDSDPTECLSPDRHCSPDGYGLSRDNKTFVTPDITTSQPVQFKPRFAVVPQTDGNSRDSGISCQSDGSRSGGKKSQGSDLAWATKNRSTGNQSSSIMERHIPTSAGGSVVNDNGNNQNDVGARLQVSGHHFLDKLPGNNPFASTHPYYCHTCRAPANTKESYESHLKGKRHMAKVGIEPAPKRQHYDAQELDDGFKPQTHSTPRDYQWELFYNAVKADSVCFLPTGTGKTMVSVMLMSTMLERYPTRPVLFIVDKVLLVLQQSKYITAELGEFEFARYNPDELSSKEIRRRRLRIATLCMDQQSTHGVPLWKHDVIVVTAAFCQNLLDRKIILWEDFSLVVFDEAHHCDKKHPFNVLLYSHHLPIYDGRFRPKILGLTASPAGKDTVQATLLMLEKLVANMGGVNLNIVQQCKATLAKFQSNAQIIIRPQPDQINETVNKFILELQVYLVHCYLKLVVFSDIEVYLNLRNVNRTSNDEEIRLFAKCIIEESLEELQLALINLQSIESENKFHVRKLVKHVESICIALNSLLEGGVPCALEEINGLENEEYNFDFAAKMFSLPCQILQALYANTKQLVENPSTSERTGGQQFGSHITRLVEELTNSLDIDWSRRETVKPMALVLVKERATVHMITKLLQNNEVMRRMNLQVTSIVGHGKTGASDAAGMKVNQQKRTLEEIKQYKYQVIVATSVAEEGVDWPECELVVSLYPPSTLTALVQMRGRARKKDSKFVVLCSCDEERELIEDLKRRERNMMEASEILFRRNLQS